MKSLHSNLMLQKNSRSDNKGFLKNDLVVAPVFERLFLTFLSQMMNAIFTEFLSQNCDDFFVGIWFLKI